MNGCSTAMRNIRCAITMNFDKTPEFIREFKQLHKKHRSLPKDLEDFCGVVGTTPVGASKHFHVLNETDGLQIVKARLACRSLKGNSLRIIYAYLRQEQRIEFLELYFKGDKENEDRGRIKRYLAARAK